MGFLRAVTLRLVQPSDIAYVSCRRNRSTTTDSHCTTRNCCSSNEITCRACITLDQNGFGTDVGFRGGDVEGWLAIHVTVDLDCDSEFFHEADCEGYVGGGDEFVFDGDCHVSGCGGGCHEEGGEELG